MKKKLLVALLGAALAAGSALADQKVVIGALIRNLDDQFLNDYTANLKKSAAAKNVELKVMDAHSDMATQLDQLNTLVSQGVNEKQTSIRSLGKSQPKVEGHDENAWSQNRRVEFIYETPKQK